MNDNDIKNEDLEQSDIHTEAKEENTATDDKKPETTDSTKPAKASKPVKSVEDIDLSILESVKIKEPSTKSRLPMIIFVAVLFAILIGFTAILKSGLHSAKDKKNNTQNTTTTNEEKPTENTKQVSEDDIAIAARHNFQDYMALGYGNALSLSRLPQFLFPTAKQEKINEEYYKYDVGFNDFIDAYEKFASNEVYPISYYIEDETEKFGFYECEEKLCFMIPTGMGGAMDQGYLIDFLPKEGTKNIFVAHVGHQSNGQIDTFEISTNNDGKLLKVEKQ